MDLLLAGEVEVLVQQSALSGAAVSHLDRLRQPLVCTGQPGALQNSTNDLTLQRVRNDGGLISPRTGAVFVARNGGETPVRMLERSNDLCCLGDEEL
jgi:hypothetical protein